MKNKKGVSIMIGYILLVAAAVVMGVIIYQWIKTYVPKEVMECPDEVSIFIENYTYTENELTLRFQNNGKFSIAGYFIRVKNDSAQEVAVVDLSQKLIETGEKIYMNAVLFLGNEENTFEPGDERVHKFNLTDVGEIYLVEISPARFQTEDNKKKFVNCGNSKIEEVISESAEEPPETCGDGNCDSGECDSCSQDCTHSECCGDGTCNNGETCGDTDNEPECNSDCEICERTQIVFIGFESGDEINNWEEDQDQKVNGESLMISGTNECSPKSGNYMLSGTGNFDPYLVRYKRTAIDVTDYNDIKISGSVASEDTESGDRIEFHYYTGSSWEICYQAVNRNGYTCAGWENFECDVNLDSGVTDLVIGVAWETSETKEHAFWDDINITGITA